MVRADKAYYRTHRGDVVGGDHPDRHTLLCKQGELISDELAERVGLILAKEFEAQEREAFEDTVIAGAVIVEAEATHQAVTEPPTTQAVNPPTRAKAKAKAPKAKA